MTSINSHPAINSAGSLSVNNQIFEKIKSSGTTSLDNITCLGPLVCSGSIKVKNSQLNTMNVSGSTDLRNSIATDIVASGNFYASDCANLGKVKTSGHAHFVNCNEIKEIKASASLSLLTTRVEGDVTHSGTDIQVNDSVITGKLECADRKIFVNDSIVEKIIVKPVNTFSSYSFESFEFFGIKFAKRETSTSPKQIIELSGKNCVVGSICFEEGVKGKLVLKNGAKVTGEIFGEFLKEC